MSTADIFNRFMCDHGILRSRICKVCVRAFRIELLERAVAEAAKQRIAAEMADLGANSESECREANTRLKRAVDALLAEEGKV